MNDSVLNGKVQNGLKAQYSEQRTAQIIETAQSVFHYRNPHSPNNPELYELFEAGYVDEALQTLGYGKWAIGRPGPSNGKRLSTKSWNGNGSQRITNKADPLATDHVGGSWEQAISDLLPRGDLPKSRRFGDNAIVHRKVLVVGAMGKGKTTLIQALAEEASRGSGSFAGYMERASLAGTLTDGVSAIADTWFFGVDDLTLARIDPIDVNNYYQIRHLIARKTGLRQGLVVTAMGVHRFHGLDVNLGSEFDQLWVKSLPDRPHDRAIVQSYFDHLPRYKRRNGEQCRCKACEFERIGEPNDKALVRLSDGTTHIIQVPFPKRNVLIDLSKPRIPSAYVAAQLGIGVGLLIAVGLVVWTLVRVWLRFA